MRSACEPRRTLTKTRLSSSCSAKRCTCSCSTHIVSPRWGFGGDEHASVHGLTPMATPYRRSAAELHNTPLATRPDLIAYWRHVCRCFATPTSRLDRTSDRRPRLLHGIASQFNRTAMCELLSRNATACVSVPVQRPALNIGQLQWTGKSTPSSSNPSRCRRGLLRPRVALLRNSIATGRFPLGIEVADLSLRGSADTPSTSTRMKPADCRVSLRRNVHPAFFNTPASGGYEPSETTVFVDVHFKVFVSVGSRRTARLSR